MRVGVPGAIAKHEYRVGLVRSPVAGLVHPGHEVRVGAGLGLARAVPKPRARAPVRASSQAPAPEKSR